MADPLNFTKRTLEALPAAPRGKRAYYADTKIDGLQLAVTDRGAKTYVLYRKFQGKPTRFKLGRYPDMTPAAARDKATVWRGKLAQGIDPRREERRERARAITLAQAFEAFKAARKGLKPRTVYDYGRYLIKAFPGWQSKRLTDITKDMVTKRHAQLSEQNGAAYANNAMTFLRSLWNFAAAHYEDESGHSLLPENPVSRLTQTRSWNKIQRRSTWIQAHQLPAWFEAVQALRQEPVGSPAATVGDYLLLLLFTGLRRGEGAALTWTQIDLKARTLSVTDTKNREPHRLPLSDFLLDLLAERERHAVSGSVFPGNGATGHLIEPRRHMTKVIEASGVDFILHDLRRTFITVAESLDIPAYALKRLLNHKMTNDVTAGYIVTDVERLRRPMQTISDFLLSAADTHANKITHLRTPRREPIA